MTRSRALLATVGVTGLLTGLGASNAIAEVSAGGVRTDAVAASHAVTSHVATARATTRAPSDAAAVTSAVRRVMGTASIPGAIVGVWRPGQPAYVRAFGVRNRRTRQAMSTGLYMRIGSETKTFTVTAVLQLVDQHKLRLDDPIGRYVSGVPDGNLITIRELAEMRSGLPSYSRNAAFGKKLQANPFQPWTPRQLLSYAYSQKMSFKPGTSFEYSNTNTVLLGLLVQRLSGESLPVYIERHILKPLGLNHTSFATSTRFPSPHANGYTNQTANGKVADATNWSPTWGWAAGAMISNLSDMRAWAKDVATGTLLTHRTQIQRERFLKAPGFGSAGYGLGLFNVGGWIGHNGSLPGYQTLVVYLPSRRATMVLLINSDIAYKRTPLSTLLGEAITKVITPRNVYTFG
jgi:D-alanyl-D-alanine carboxypeptidase